jgi:hypothetical protein
MHKNATKCNETLSKWCKNKHGASKIIDTLETYHAPPMTFVGYREHRQLWAVVVWMTQLLDVLMVILLKMRMVCHTTSSDCGAFEGRDSMRRNLYL